MIGKTIGKYRIVGQLGRGGMGTVYKAVDESLDREVAIKVLNPELADTDIMRRFRTEATTLARLNHPEIATIYELFRSETDLLMVMEFVKGETLDRLSDRLGPLPPERAVYLIDKVLSALEHAHRAGVVHRDMKPANVMITETGGVKIMDFGIARVRGAEHMTVDGYMMGTPAYMPPEQVLGQEVDGRADLYSVGVVLYRLLTGSLPFKADTAIGMVQKQISDEPTPLRTHRAGLPDWCEGLLHRALAKSPADRFQTAEQFREALGNATGMVTTGYSKPFSAEDLEVTTPPQLVMLDKASLTPGGGSAMASVPAAAASDMAMPALQAAASAPKTAPRARAVIDGATIVLRKKHFAVAGSLLAVAALGVAVLAYVALTRAPSAPVPGTSARSQTASAAASAPPTSPPPQSDQPAGAATPVTSGAPSASPAAASSTASTAAATPSQPGAAAIETSASASTPLVAGRAANAARTAESRGTAKPSAALATVKTFVPLALDARALVGAGNQQRERDAKVHLADGKVTVTPEDNPSDVIHATPYDAVVSISYSRGRDPLWNSPEGPAPVLRAGAGALGGMFRGTRHWVTLRTRDARDLFIVLRFANDVQVKRALTALEERTGRTTELVAERKDAK